MAVLKTSTAIYEYLELLPQGVRITIYTTGQGGNDDGAVAVVRKESDKGDWNVTYPKGADETVIRDSWSNAPGIISSKDIARAFLDRGDLWGDVDLPGGDDADSDAEDR